MGTMTAHMLVGRQHPHHGGIIPTHYVMLSENDRPVWSIVPESLYGGRQGRIVRHIIPSNEQHILKDGLLSIVHLLWRDEHLQQIQNQVPKLSKGTVELGRVPDDVREDMYRISMASKGGKIILSVFEGSSITSQLPDIKDYAMDIEVCTLQYARLYSEWTQKTVAIGDLEVR